MGDFYRVDSDERVRIDGDPVNSRKTIKNFGPDSCYYGGETVSSTNNTGTLAVGSSLSIPPGFWFISAGRSRLYEARVENPGPPVYATSAPSAGTLTVGQFAIVENADGTVDLYYEDGT